MLSTVAACGHDAAQRRPAQTPPVASSPAHADEAWRACAEAGDNECVIRELGARDALGAREQITLIEAYRMTSDTPRMCARMRDFVARFPDG